MEFAETLETRFLLTGSPPVITTTQAVTNPAAANAVPIVSQVTDSYSLTSINLTYTANTGSSGTITTPMSETFGTTAQNSWNGGSGTGTDNLWTVTANPVPFKLLTAANYVSSNSACGLQFNCSKEALATIATTNSFDVAGSSATVTYWIKSVPGTTGSAYASQDYVTLELNSGSGYVACAASSVTTNSNGFTEYSYNLTNAQLVPAEKMEFAFSSSGNASDTTLIYLDQISVSLTVGGPSPVSVPMAVDSAAGAGYYDATIPAEPSGTVVSYYVSATNSAAEAPPALRAHRQQNTPIPSGRLTRLLQLGPRRKTRPPSHRARPVWVTTNASDQTH